MLESHEALYRKMCEERVLLQALDRLALLMQEEHLLQVDQWLHSDPSADRLQASSQAMEAAEQDMANRLTAFSVADIQDIRELLDTLPARPNR